MRIPCFKKTFFSVTTLRIYNLSSIYIIIIKIWILLLIKIIKILVYWSFFWFLLITTALHFILSQCFLIYYAYVFQIKYIIFIKLLKLLRNCLAVVNRLLIDLIIEIWIILLYLILMKIYLLNFIMKVKHLDVSRSWAKFEKWNLNSELILI